MVVDLHPNYNAILGRPILYELEVATSIYHYCMKFPTPYRVGIACGDQVEARACNIDLPRPHICMLENEQNARARKERQKKPIMVDLSEINITEKHCRKPVDDHLLFDDKEADPDAYLRVLVIQYP